MSLPQAAITPMPYQCKNKWLQLSGTQLASGTWINDVVIQGTNWGPGRGIWQWCVTEVIYLWVISIADILEILVRFKKMGFSASAGNTNGTHRPLSRSLAGANKWALHKNAPPAFCRARSGSVSCRTWLWNVSPSAETAMFDVFFLFNLRMGLCLTTTLLGVSWTPWKHGGRRKVRVEDSPRQTQVFLAGYRLSQEILWCLSSLAVQGGNICRMMGICRKKVLWDRSWRTSAWNIL